MKFFEVFKAGKYPQGNFTKKEIAQIAKNYDPTFCEAPITIDHQQSGPAYGWVETVKAEGDKLKVAFKDVPETFEKDVNDGKYKKVSVELYRNLEGKGAYFHKLKDWKLLNLWNQNRILMSSQTILMRKSKI